VSGRGAYDLGTIMQVARGLGKAFVPTGSFGKAGAYLGNKIGPRAGAMGKSAGDMVAKLAGFGDYVVNSNSIMSGAETIPTFSSQADGIRIRHREFIQDISGSTAFGNSFVGPINPSNPAMFPWLSQVADNFEAYRFDGVVFEYRSTSEFSTTNPALGTILMCGIYDVNKPPFATKQSLETYEFSTSIKPNMNGYMPIECKPSTLTTPNLLVGPLPAGGQPQLYDIAQLQIATQGQPTVYICGELWVTYDIVLQKPRISSSFGPTQVVSFPNTTSTGLLPGGSSGWRFAGNPLACYRTIGLPSAFTLGLAGNYLLEFYGFGAGYSTNPLTVSLTDPNTLITNLTPAGSYYMGAGGASNNSLGAINVAATQWRFGRSLIVPTAGSWFQFTTAATGSANDITVIVTFVGPFVTNGMFPPTV